MKNIVICCDGTGNEISENISSVLKLYRCVRKTPKTSRSRGVRTPPPQCRADRRIETGLVMVPPLRIEPAASLRTKPKQPPV
jgi:hypothetical protein